MLEEIKAHLKITWNDEDININGFIARGKIYLDDLMGSTLIYDEDGQPKSLLFDYCRYAYNNALEYFEENFSKEILRLQLKIGISLMPVEVVE